MIIKNLGVIKMIDIDFNNNIFLTGANNSGKTYLSYLIYGIISQIKEGQDFSIPNSDILKDLVIESIQTKRSLSFSVEKEIIEKSFLTQIVKYIELNIHDIAVSNFMLPKSKFHNLAVSICEKDVSAIIGDMFGYVKKSFSVNGVKIYIVNRDFNIDINIEHINDTSEDFDDGLISIICDRVNNLIIDVPSIFYIPAERTGINVFRHELNDNRLNTYNTLLNTIQYASLTNQAERNKMKHKLLKQNINYILDTSGSNSYPKPISDYIKFLNSINSRKYNPEVESPGNFIRDEILNGKFEIDEKDNSVLFRHKHGKSRFKTEAFPLHVVSSSVKSLYGLDYYLDNNANVGDFIILDEPELSLHVENQVKIANLIDLLIKKGYRIIVSTHSDVIIRELLNLSLKDKIGKNDNSLNPSMYYDLSKSSEKNGIKQFTNLEEFDVFDKTFLEIQDSYYDLLDKYDELLLEKKSKKNDIYE